MAKPAKLDTKSRQRILTPEFRVSYPHIFSPSSYKGADPKYSITMLFKKTTDLSQLKLAVKHAKVDKWGPNVKDWPEMMREPIQDGDGKKYKDNKECHGHWVVKASAKAEYQPQLVDSPGADPIIDKQEFYAGCYARAQIFAFAYDGNPGGVTFILDMVQMLRDGKPLSSKKDAKAVFGAQAASEDFDSDGDSDDDSSSVDSDDDDEESF